jgi:LmbE family N-acetylglucosaminyl deacetylase
MSNIHADGRDTRDRLPAPDRVLTVGAHPDDAEFGAGATIARWASEGAELVMCIVTDGSRGSWDPDEDPDALAARRIAEQEAAGAVLGARHIVHLGLPDGELESSVELRNEIARQICIFSPDIVLSHDPWQRYQLHPDHRATGIATADAVVRAREPLAMRGSGLDAHRPSTFLLWSADEPDHAEPVDEAWFARKVEALLCHASQSSTTMSGAAEGVDQREAFTTRLWAWQFEQGSDLGVGPSETFKRLTP